MVWIDFAARRRELGWRPPPKTRLPSFERHLAWLVNPDALLYAVAPPCRRPVSQRATSDAQTWWRRLTRRRVCFAAGCVRCTQACHRILVLAVRRQTSEGIDRFLCPAMDAEYVGTYKPVGGENEGSLSLPRPILNGCGQRYSIVAPPFQSKPDNAL